MFLKHTNQDISIKSLGHACFQVSSTKNVDYYRRQIGETSSSHHSTLTKSQAFDDVVVVCYTTKWLTWATEKITLGQVIVPERCFPWIWGVISNYILYKLAENLLFQWKHIHKGQCRFQGSPNAIQKQRTEDDMTQTSAFNKNIFPFALVKIYVTLQMQASPASFKNSKKQFCKRQNTGFWSPTLFCHTHELLEVPKVPCRKWHFANSHYCLPTCR